MSKIVNPTKQKINITHLIAVIFTCLGLFAASFASPIFIVGIGVFVIMYLLSFILHSKILILINCGFVLLYCAVSIYGNWGAFSRSYLAAFALIIIPVLFSIITILNIFKRNLKEFKNGS